jgi:adenylate cyclase, class 2
MSFVEIEVKFHISDIVRMRERLADMGAVRGINARETNIRFEDRQNGLYRQKALLRLRKADKTTLTFKSKPPGGSDPNRQFKILNELEVVVDNFDVMHRILDALGFHAEQIYEKNRETWALGQTRFCLDQMPYGTFMEIEGEPEAIRQAAGLLELEWPDRILRNYLEMFDIIKTGKNLNFTDVTFENFTGIDIDIADYLPIFRAG